MQDVLLQTDFLPADRVPYSLLRDCNNAIRQWPPLTALMEQTPDRLLLLNEQRQILYCNQAFLLAVGVLNSDAILGLRLGEALGCVNSELRPGGCGTTAPCQFCSLAKAIVDTLAWGGTMGARTARIKRSSTESLRVQLEISSVLVGTNRLLLCRWPHSAMVPITPPNPESCPIELQELLLALTDPQHAEAGQTAP